MTNNNVLNSLIATSVKFKFNLNIGCPKNYRPPKFVMDWVKKIKEKLIFLMIQKKQQKMQMLYFQTK